MRQDASLTVAPTDPAPRWPTGYEAVLREAGAQEKTIPYCIRWVRTFFSRHPGRRRRDLGRAEIEAFLSELGRAPEQTTGRFTRLRHEATARRDRRASPWRSTTNASAVSPWHPGLMPSHPRRPALIPRRCERRSGRDRRIRALEPSSNLLSPNHCICVELTLLLDRKSRFAGKPPSRNPP